MIHSAEQFVALRSSVEIADYQQAATEQATFETWADVIARFPEMRTWVAYNKTVPLEILRILSKDADRVVRGSVAEKRMLDHELFERLSHDPDETVRQRIAYNKRTPADIIERLISDESPFVRDAALRARQPMLNSSQ